MTDFINQTLAEIVTKDHRTAALFEKYHLDFCCKGKRTLSQACEELSIPAAELVNELAGITAAPDSATDFNKMSLTELVHHIVNTYHVYVKNEMTPLLAYLQKVTAKHGGRHPEMHKITALFSALKEEMEMHMQKEEMILFPRITETEKFVFSQHNKPPFSLTYLQAPVSVMEQEHDHAGEIMSEIRKLTNDYTPPADACTTYRLSYASLEAFEKELHQHVHLENNILFPKAIDLFRDFKETILN
jgi:regulator of cell morphogenesis and NO signaling